jgi:hypothetical protein
MGTATKWTDNARRDGLRSVGANRGRVREHPSGEISGRPMTYIVGLKQPGINAIISDARLTWDDGTGANTALKTGLLCPGLIFGRAGSSAQGAKFIADFRRSITGTITIRGIWDQFVRFAERYEFHHDDDNDAFALLVSSRGEGEPLFAVLESRRGLSVQRVPDDHACVLTIGSGKELLDPHMRERFSRWLQALQTQLVRDWEIPIQATVELVPYFMCLWLTEMSCAFEASQLADVGVGGAFHFIFQTPSREASQDPALYLLIAPDYQSRNSYVWGIRIVYVQGGLWVERFTPRPEEAFSEVLFDRASRPDIDQIPLATLRAQVTSDVAALPLYKFLGVGFTDPDFRAGYTFRYVSQGATREDTFTATGVPTPALNAMLQAAILLRFGNFTS